MTWGDGGLRWPVWRQGGVLLSVEGQAAAAGFASGVTETVTAVDLYLSRLAGDPQVTLDVWAASSLPNALLVDTYRPNEDVATTGWTDEGGATTDLYLSINEATLDTSTYIVASTSYYYGRVGSGAHGAGTIRSVKVAAWVARPGGTAHHIRFRLNIGDTDYADSNDSVSDADGVVKLVSEWTVNPATGAAWTQADIQAFDTTDEIAIYPGTDGEVYQLWMEVVTDPDPVATATAEPAADGWTTFTLDSSWSKTDTTGYVLVLRKVNTDGQAVWNALDSSDDCPHVSWVSYSPTMGGFGTVSALGDSATAALAAVLDVSGTPSADSQPYATLSREKVYTGRTVEQEFTPSGAFTAGWVSSVVGLESGDTDADLTVKVIRRSDDVQMGGTLTFTADDVAEAPRKLRELVGNLASTASLTTVQYYVEWASAATAGQGWEVAVLDVQGNGAAVGYGGTANAATAGSTQDTDTDVPFAVTAVPAQVTGVTATGAAGQVTVGWTGTSLGASFARYVISRDGIPIAHIGTEATVSWVDTEAKLGTAEDYTVQVENVDGETSLPSTAASGTATGNEFRLVTNHNTTVNLDVLIQLDPSLGFPTHRAVDYPHGRDYALVRRGSDILGDVWSVSLWLDDATSRALFADILATSRADVPHLTLLSPFGERWYVDVDVSGGTLPIHTLATAEATIVEVAGTPTPVDV